MSKKNFPSLRSSTLSSSLNDVFGPYHRLPASVCHANCQLAPIKSLSIDCLNSLKSASLISPPGTVTSSGVILPGPRRNGFHPRISLLPPPKKRLFRGMVSLSPIEIGRAPDSRNEKSGFGVIGIYIRVPADTLVNLLKVRALDGKRI